MFPAPAGINRVAIADATSLRRVPRASGDKPGIITALIKLITEVMVETQNFRFIPAGAGNTAPLKICTKAIAVYPRWRGEHYFCNAQRYSRIGLSPLARGTHKNKTPKRLYLRFIPAGAGKVVIDNVDVFPAPAGINRCRGNRTILCRRVPRASGDKPPSPIIGMSDAECSPRQRG